MIEVKRDIEKILLTSSLSKKEDKILLEEGAKLYLYLFEDLKNVSLNIEQETNSYCEIFFLNRGENTSININMNGENCRVNVAGIYNLNGKHSANINTNVRHNYPNCESAQSFRGLAHDKSIANVNMMTYVAPNASKSDGCQLHKSILLSDDAKIFAKPELEIYNDDVKCSHGNTIGSIDKEILFYLQSRGIPLKRAKEMLINGFLQEVTKFISQTDFQIQVINKINAKF